MHKDLDQPQLVKFTKKKVVVKDYDFYKGKDNLWNKFPHMDNKIYSQFHKNNEDKKELINSQHEQETQEKKYMEYLRVRAIGNKKIEDKSRYFQRIEERELIQNKSKQNAGNLGFSRSLGGDDALDELIAKKTGALRHSRISENSWNYQEGLSKKYANQYLTPAVLKGEEYRIHVIKNSLDQEKLQEEDNKLRQFMIRQEIKEDLATRRENNSKVMKQLGILSKKGDLSQSAPTSESKAYASNIFLTTQNKPSQKESRKSMASSSTNSHSEAQFSAEDFRDWPVSDSKQTIKQKSHFGPDIDRLSIPKQSSVKTFNQAKTELKGSLIQNFDKSSFYPENEFYQFLLDKSRICQEALEDVKPSARRTIPRNQSVPPIAESSILDELPQLSPRNEAKNMFALREDAPVYEMNSTPIGSGPSNNRKDVLDELAAFEKRISQKPKKTGYSRMDLQKSYKTSLHPVLEKAVGKGSKIEKIDEQLENFE